MNVLSIDVGTSTLKSALINSHYGILGCLDINYFDYFNVNFENFDYKIWIFALKKIMSHFIYRKIDCISISGISPCLIALVLVCLIFLLFGIILNLKNIILIQVNSLLF
ncbi:Xylulose kinase [Borrelia duttonii CR2A]|uniref:Xylulose kinase n=1 Tax=Borrelia duttonii CR2A TaxID=1432657 RepID=W6TI12_9SPIR|nr:Xylulose kinase [Borrelia duttonii CR2A]